MQLKRKPSHKKKIRKWWMSEHPKNTALRFSPQFPWRQQGLAQCLMPGLCKAAAWRLSPGVTVELLNFWQFLCLLCPSFHFKLVSDDSIIYFCIYFRLTLKINEHLSTVCQCLKSPLRAFLVGKGSFSKTERTKLRAESHNVRKAKKN